MTWVGLKTLAFIPLSRTDAQPPDIIPPDWTDEIMQRVSLARRLLGGDCIHDPNSSLRRLHFVQPRRKRGGRARPPEVVADLC